MCTCMELFCHTNFRFFEPSGLILSIEFWKSNVHAHTVHLLDEYGILILASKVNEYFTLLLMTVIEYQCFSLCFVFQWVLNFLVWQSIITFPWVWTSNSILHPDLTVHYYLHLVWTTIGTLLPGLTVNYYLHLVWTSISTLLPGLTVNYYLHLVWTSISTLLLCLTVKYFLHLVWT